MNRLLKENERLKKEMEAVMQKEKHKQQVELLKEQNKVAEDRIVYLKDMERKLKQIVLDWKKSTNKNEVIKNLQDLLFNKQEKIIVNNVLLELSRVTKLIYPHADIDYPDVSLKPFIKAKFKTVKFGNNVLVGKNVKIGKNCLIMAYSHVAHDCFIGDNCIFSNNSTLAGHVTVGSHVILAGMVAVHQFCSIGNHAFVAGGSLVRKDVPPFVKAAREPLSYVGINSIGLRRRGFSPDKIKEIQGIYRLLFQKNHNTSQAASIIEAEMEATPERDEILEFIKNAKRGIMKGYLSNN